MGSAILWRIHCSSPRDYEADVALHAGGFAATGRSRYDGMRGASALGFSGLRSIVPDKTARDQRDGLEATCSKKGSM